MSAVHILPPDVIAKIAAGEVVDRPASVVKELMENALDAGASTIEVNLKGGGKTSIQIKDNGSGIARDDLERLFTRHATSKITHAEDLDALVSLGFRGEALYSIAAVSEVTVRTKTEKAEGWEIFLRGGKREHVSPAAMASRGTEVNVEEIFFNTPARKKFLKADSSELDAVINVFLPYALQFPKHHFVLVHNDRKVYDLKPAENFASRAAEALNLEARHIIEVDDILAAENIRVKLILGDINIQRPRRDLQYFFVNGRPVQHKNLSFQVNDVCRMIMPEGVYPFFVVFIDVPALEVDVNIHPQKREVRLKNEGRIGSFLRQAVERALMTKGGAKEVGAPLAHNPVFSFAAQGFSRQEGLPADRIIFAPGQTGEVPTFRGMERGEEAGSSANTLISGDLFSQRDGGIKDRLLRSRFLGTFARKYHLFEEGDSLFALDQHAAQERILFEKFLAQVRGGKVEGQRLLTPLVVKLTQSEMMIWESGEEDWKAFGFDTSRLDEGAVLIHAHPALLKQPEFVFRALLVEDKLSKRDHDAFARRACRASVMTGDAMSSFEAIHQLKELSLCQDPMTCPHGRPVFIELKVSFFDRQFLRSS